MSSASNYIAILCLAVSVVCLGGCHSTASPPPVASGAQATMANKALYQTNPVENDPVSIADGRRLFRWYNCYACHGPHGGGAIGPNLRDHPWSHADSSAHIFTSIAQGSPNGMPAWGKKIPDIQIWELTAYIQSLGTSREPNPPQEPANEVVRDPKKSASIVAGKNNTHAGRQ